LRILITGNLGYVGPCVTRHLRARYPDATLIGVDIGYFAHCLTGVSRAPEALLDAHYFADVRRFPAHLLDGVDAIVHLAAVSNDPMGNTYEAVTLDVNYRAGIDLARQAKAAGVTSFIFASSCSVYGFAEDRPRTERSAVNPLTAYAKSKVLTEQALRDLSEQHFRVTCLRFATGCGFSDRLRLDLVLNDFVASALSTRSIAVLSDGTPWRPLINVKDMALAIEWAVGRNAAAGGNFLIVNTGSDQWNYRVHELADAVASVVPGTKVEINHEAPPDLRSYRVDFSLFRTLAPMHQPQSDLRQTIAELRRGLIAIGFCDTGFRNSSFIRLKVLADLEELGMLSRTLEWTDKRGAAAADAERIRRDPPRRRSDGISSAAGVKPDDIQRDPAAGRLRD
jgi:nucleoside-diphosphate-sugar epimerase